MCENDFAIFSIHLMIRTEAFFFPEALLYLGSNHVASVR